MVLQLSLINTFLLKITFFYNSDIYKSNEVYQILSFQDQRYICEEENQKEPGNLFFYFIAILKVLFKGFTNEYLKKNGEVPKF